MATHILARRDDRALWLLGAALAALAGCGTPPDSPAQEGSSDDSTGEAAGGDDAEGHDATDDADDRDDDGHTDESGDTTGAPPSETSDTGTSDSGASTACVPGSAFGPVMPYAPLAHLELSEPWLSADGEVLIATMPTGDFESGLGLSTRASTAEPFSEPEPIIVEGWPDSIYQGSLDAQSGELVFQVGGEVYRAPATNDPTVFGAPSPASFVYPEYTEWPEFPRAAEGGLYVSLRELNHRRSIYSHASGASASLPLLYDAGDIFTFTVTPDGLTLYVTFSDESYDLVTYRGTRGDTTSSFGGLEPLPQFDLDDRFATTAVTGDDCEVFGWVTDSSGNSRLWHAVRGG